MSAEPIDASAADRRRYWVRSERFEPLADRYDGFIFDVWGTLYGGGPVFEGARVVLERLAALGKPVVILSNAPRPARVVADRLAPLGIPGPLYQAIVTSGEETRRALVDRTDAFASLGPRCVNMGGSRFGDLLAGTGFREVGTVEEADWVHNPGPKGPFDRVEDYGSPLRRALERDLVMVCANPDIHVVDEGAKKICAGAIAAAYEALGGRVLYHGKPHRPVFDRAVAHLGLGGRPDPRVLVVGDNRATDVAGAEMAGLDSLMLADGIDADSLLDDSGALDESRLAAFTSRPGPRASWLATRLAW